MSAGQIEFFKMALGFYKFVGWLIGIGYVGITAFWIYQYFKN